MITQNTFKKRFCFLCLQPIFFSDFCETNTTKNTIKDLKDLWQFESIELACCNCHQMIKRIKGCLFININAIEWATDDKLEKLLQFNIICQEDVLELNNLKKCLEC
jgi:hypothetical protein